jgi:deoxyribodipyrimidine photo-lyase
VTWLPTSTTAVVWFRRDLRLRDHPALVEACRHHHRVVPLFVWDPALLHTSGPARVAFLGGCVDYLRDSLGGALVIRRGRPAAEVPAVARECDASMVFISADYGPYGTARDRDVAEALAADGRHLKAVGSPYAIDPGQLFTKANRPFQVFTPFSRAWRPRAWGRTQRRPTLRGVSDAGLASHRDPDLSLVDIALPEPGEEAAHRRLDRFVRRSLDTYRNERDRPDLDSTSRLSAYLRFGCLHPRQLLARLEPLNPSHERFVTQLCWREFYADMLHHRPDAARQSYRPEWHRMEVDEGPLADRRFHAWTQGLTGYPVVDAGMRQLLAEGWMHNRVRLITASFLVKDLHIDWTRGAHWFMQRLVDGDLASNQLNWQWVAGSGNDAAPFFRVFNPVSQGQRFDLDGRYVRRWIPELSDVPDRYVHEPWKAEPADYPPPIVDHADERREALNRYKTMRHSFDSQSTPRTPGRSN